jgi:hypothetical protein
MLLSFSQSSISWGQASLSEARIAVVQRLYEVVISRVPVGVSTQGDHLPKVFAPYLSKRLIREINTTRLCEKSWYARHRDPLVKPPFAWLEFGPFSGADDLSGASEFHIERQESQKDGSTYVYVRLKSRQQTCSNDLPKALPEKAFYWDVAVRVVMDGENPVVDDIVYLKGQGVDSESRLSAVLTTGCKGTHWVGNPAEE